MTQLSIKDELIDSLSLVRCDLCGSNHYTHLLADEISNIVRCNECDLIFYNPQPSEAALQSYYTSQSEDSYTTSMVDWYGQLTKERMEEDRGHLSLLENVYQQNNPYYHNDGKPIRFLEVGPGFGYMLYSAKQLKEWDVIGVELGKAQTDFARNSLNLNYINGDLEEATKSLEMNSFDIILMGHSLEHNLHPKRTVQFANRLLKLGGLLVIYVPNGGGFLGRHKLDKWEWRHFPGHLYYFSKQTLQMLLKDTGFQTERINSTACSSDYDYIKTEFCIDSDEVVMQIASLLGPLAVLGSLNIMARKITES